ncbi:MAG: DNA repair protein RecN [Muribaculaceae bacterium]|nr:DNA repair protein RecN [Muribaculaceae bacterium]
MIESLHISNYALIDKIDIDFHVGLNIITGETGAGKSIILGALSLILGERADTKVVRDNQKKSVIEAIFSARGYKSLEQYCSENEIDWDNEQCILRREITPNGRSRAFVNDTPVSLTQLQFIAQQLVDIHSQHQNQLLSSADYQLNVIDNLAKNENLLKEYSSRYSAFRNTVRKLKTTRNLIEQNNSEEEFMRFQLQHLERMNLVAGEQSELEKERDMLANMTDIKMRLESALAALTHDNINALSLIKEASDSCSHLSSILPNIEELTSRLEASRIEIQDITETLSEYDNNLNANPNDLDAIEQRLSEIYSLQHRHNVNSVEELISIREEIKEKLNAIENSEDVLKQLEVEAKQAQRYALEIAKEISSARKKEAEIFAKMLTERALPLGMKNLQCKVDVTNTTSLQPNGIDNIEFLFAFNKNQQLMPIGGKASGGEISRLMLSIKSIIADKMQLPSIIFDEVDTGVSGDVASRMGEMMHNISKNIQVIAITHLPQVAAKGDWQYKVYKEDDDTTTQTQIKQLTIDERINEIAIMLSGSTIEDTAIANARSLLNLDK